MINVFFLQTKKWLVAVIFTEESSISEGRILLEETKGWQNYAWRSYEIKSTRDRGNFDSWRRSRRTIVRICLRKLLLSQIYCDNSNLTSTVDIRQTSNDRITYFLIYWSTNEYVKNAIPLRLWCSCNRWFLHLFSSFCRHSFLSIEKKTIV